MVMLSSRGALAPRLADSSWYLRISPPIPPGALAPSSSLSHAPTNHTHHNQTVEDFTRIDHRRRSLDEHIVADLMAGPDDLVGVPVGMGIIAHPSIAGPRVG